MRLVFLSSAGVSLRAVGRPKSVSGETTKIAQLVLLAMLGSCLISSKNTAFYLTFSVNSGGKSAVKILRSPPFLPGIVISKSLACRNSR